MRVAGAWGVSFHHPPLVSSCPRLSCRSGGIGTQDRTVNNSSRHKNPTSITRERREASLHQDQKPSIHKPRPSPA